MFSKNVHVKRKDCLDCFHVEVQGVENTLKLIFTRKHTFVDRYYAMVQSHL